MALASDAQNPDAGLNVSMYSEAVELTFKTREVGYPVFEDRDFIQIMVPGDSLNIIRREVTEEDKRRFPLHWARYQEMRQPTASPGFPVEEWPAVSRAVGKNLRAMGFDTVEQVAAASDQNIARLGMMAGMQPAAFREKAKAFLTSAKDSALAQKQAAELVESKQRIADLEQQVRDVNARFEAMESKKGKKQE